MMSDRLPNESWGSLSQNGLFLRSLFEGQHEQLQQLKELNAFLQTQVADTLLHAMPDDAQTWGLGRVGSGQVQSSGFARTWLQ